MSRLLNNQLDKRYPSKNVLLIFLLSFISLFYFILIQQFMPIRFKFDSNNIRNGMSNPLLVDKSFRQVADLLKSIGINYYTPMIIMNIISWIIFVLILITIIKINRSILFHKYQILLLLLFMLMYGFYFTNYSKDIIVLIFFMIAINLPRIHNNLLINIILAIIIYGYFFRTYWIVIGILSLMPLFIKKIQIKRDLFYIFLATIFFIIIFNYIKHMQVTSIRVQTNQFRIGRSNARSIITNIVSNSSVYTDVVNYIYCLVSLFLPIQGFPSVNIIIYYIWIIGIVIFCIRHRKHVNLRLILILVIYVNIQALFEPDFGSVFRHQLAWFIVLYDALCPNNIYYNKKYNYNEN